MLQPFQFEGPTFMEVQASCTPHGVAHGQQLRCTDAAFCVLSVSNQ